MKNKKEYKKTRRRVGRGSGSGAGKTCGRGSKGQMSRSGSSRTPGFEGGQMTFVRRLPKRGFNNTRFEKHIEIINIRELGKIDEPEITPAILIKHGFIKKRYDGVKVLGTGGLEKAVTVHANYFSSSAQKKIEAAGGKIVVLK